MAADPAQSARANGAASLEAYPNAVVSATDPGSGITVTIDPDGVSLTARAASGAVIWQRNVVAETGAPSVGSPVIRDVKIDGTGVVSIVLGKHRMVDADLKTGTLTVRGEN